jgi:hypothetical protein
LAAKERKTAGLKFFTQRQCVGLDNASAKNLLGRFRVERSWVLWLSWGEIKVAKINQL